MINRIKAVLESKMELSGWRIDEVHTIAEELFTIKKSVEMNRSKDVRHYTVTVYVNSHEGDESYTGMATYNIAPSYNENEIKAVIDTATFSAKFATNKLFSLVEPSDAGVKADDLLPKADIIDNMINIYKRMYSVDNYAEGYINSAEIFANVSYHRIMNSLGVDVSYQTNDYDIEVITQWKEQGEDVEIYEHYQYTDVNTPIDQLIHEQLLLARDKAVAKPMPQLSDIPIILGSTYIKDMMKYYVRYGNAQSVYEGSSSYVVGDAIQGEVKGDYLNITLDPMMSNSSKSMPVDADGVILEETPFIKQGVLQRYISSNQFANYLDIQPTGIIENLRVGAGSKGYEEMRREPHIEILSFSAFQVDKVTGAFGGEIRLARYYDGKTYHTFTGGSLATDVKSVQDNMYFTKELEQENEYLGPKAVLFHGTVASS